ncbi:PAS domain-containing protein [Methanocalculus sp. MC3]
MTGQSGEMIQIKELLKRNPRGMSITEISSALHLHRNTAAKYLDTLKLRGDVDRKEIGTARNYFLVQRIPVSSLLAYWPAPLIICDLRLNTVMVTEGILSLLGCSLDVMYGVLIDEIPISLFKDPRIREICHNAVSGETETHTFRATIRKKEMRIRIQGIPVVFDTGRDGAALAFFDETGHQSTSRELDLLKQQYAALKTGQREYIAHLDNKLRITYINDPFAARTQRSGKQAEGLPFTSLFPAQILHEIEELLPEITIASQSASADLMMIRNDGTVGHEQWDLRAIFDEQGGIAAYHATGRDITELYRCREQLEQYHKNFEELIEDRTRSLQEANRMLMATIREKEELERELLFIQFAFDHASDSILILNEEGRIIRANQTASTLLGYTTEELQALHVETINPSITKNIWKEMWADGYPGKRMRTRSIHRMRNGRILHVDVSRTFVRFLDQMYFCSIARPLEEKDGNGDQTIPSHS